MNFKILGIALLSLVYVACNQSNSHEGDNHDIESHEVNDHSDEESNHADEISFTKEQAQMAGLITESIVFGTFHQVIKTSGKIQASQGDETTIVATSNGTISFANPSIAEGASVGSGEVIVTVSANNLLDGDPVEKAKIAFETAEKEMNRADELIENKIISVKEYEQIKMRYETAKTTYEAQSANVTSEGIKIKSPISGYIKNRFVGQGEYVSVGQPIATISQNKKMQLRAEVSEKNYKQLRNIRTANFKTTYDDALYRLKDLNGHLLSYGRTSGAQSFYIPVTFEFDNIGDIIPGSFTEIYLITNPLDNVISVPASSVTEEQGLYFVYLQLDEEVFKKQEVGLGQNNGERVQIHSGLKEGDKVVTHGVYQVKLAATSSVTPEGHGHSH